MRKERGCLHSVLLYGGISVVLLAILLVFVVHMGNRWIYNNTGAEATDFPAEQHTKPELEGLLDRFQMFQQNVQTKIPGTQFSATGKELNLLIQNHPSFKAMNGKFRIRLEGLKLKTDFSIPLSGFSRLEGRFLNGSVQLHFKKTTNGWRLLLIHPTLKGKGLSRFFKYLLQEISDKVFSGEKKQTKQIREAFEQLKKIEVKDGKLQISAQSPDGQRLEIEVKSHQEESGKIETENP